MSRATTYAALVIVSIAFGWIEGSVAIYLRQLYYPAGFAFPLAPMPEWLLIVEIVREACTMLVLAGSAWIAGSRRAERWGAFLLLFGLWDLVYYGAIWVVLRWPETIGTWDLLFLIPVPWIGPVWAPALVAVLFTVIGSYLFFTAGRTRRYRGVDVALLVGASLVIVGTFLEGWRVVTDARVPGVFPVWWFSAAVLAGVGAFLRAERRA